MSKDNDFTRAFVMVFGFLVVFTIVVILIARSLGLDENSGPMTDRDIDARTLPYGSVKVAGGPDSAKTTPAEAPISRVTAEPAPTPEVSSTAPTPTPEATPTVTETVAESMPTPKASSAAPTPPPEATPAVTEAVAQTTPGIDGKALYAACMGCHNYGVAGAPKLGDKAAWAPRIAAGIDRMVEIALKGKGAMPPKGGRMDYSDDQVRAIVQYMAREAQ